MAEFAGIETDMDTGVVSKVIAKVQRDTAPKFDNLFNVDLMYVTDGHWHSVEMTAKTYLSILQSGEFEGRQLVATSVSEVNTELTDGSTEKVRFIYDFVRLNTNQNPWRIS